MRKDQFRGDEEQARKEMEKMAKPLIKTRRGELLKKFKCSPVHTVLMPIISQLPIFIGTSWVLSHLSQPPSLFDSEAFLTLTSLAHSDPTATLPIVLGLVTLANVESSRWFVSAEALQRERKVEEWTAQKRAKGEHIIQPKKIVQSSMRLLAVGRILIAALVPGSIQLYWVTSAMFGLLQTWVLDYWESRRIKPRTLDATSPPPVKTASSSPTKPSFRTRQSRT